MRQSAAAVRRREESPERRSIRDVQERAARSGDRETLVSSVDGLIWKEVRRFGRWLAEEDLRDVHAAGRVGALVAANKYSPDHASGASFPTYAVPWVRAYVVREVFHFWGKGRFGVTDSTLRVFFRYGRARRALDGQEAASQEEVARYLGVNGRTLAAVADVVSGPDRRLDAAPGEDRGPIDVPDDGLEDPLAALCGAVSREDVLRAVRRLSPRRRRVVEERFYRGRTLREVGEDLGVSRERVRQIEKEALGRLRKVLLASHAQ